MWFWLILGILTIIASIHAIVTKTFAADPVPLWQPEWMRKRKDKIEYLKNESSFYHWYGKTAVVQGYIFLVLGIAFTLYVLYQMYFVENTGS